MKHAEKIVLLEVEIERSRTALSATDDFADEFGKLKEEVVELLAQNAEKNIVAIDVSAVKPAKWTKTPPTEDGWYWWRKDGERSIIAFFEGEPWENGVLCGPYADIDEMGGEWLRVPEPGPENEP